MKYWRFQWVGGSSFYALIPYTISPAISYLVNIKLHYFPSSPYLDGFNSGGQILLVIPCLLPWIRGFIYMQRHDTRMEFAMGIYPMLKRLELI